MSSIDSMISCNIRQAADYLDRIIQSGLVANLISSPGIGKSSLVRKAADNWNLKLVDHRATTSVPEDQSGIPRINGDFAEFVPFAKLFPLEGEKVPEGYQGWLVFLDEFPSASKEVQASFYKFILDRMVGQHKLHERVVIVTAGNKQTDRAIVNPIGSAMASRVVHIEIHADYGVWLEDVALPNKYDERLLAFMAANPNKIMEFDPALVGKDKSFTCPRTLEFANALLGTGVEGPLPNTDNLLYAGTLSPGTATEFVQFTQVYKNMIPLSSILKDPENCRIPDKADLYWATVTSLSNLTTIANHSDIFRYVNRLTMTYQILFYRSVKLILPEITNSTEWRQAATKLGRHLYAEETEE